MALNYISCTPESLLSSSFPHTPDSSCTTTTATPALSLTTPPNFLEKSDICLDENLADESGLDRIIGGEKELESVGMQTTCSLKALEINGLPEVSTLDDEEAQLSKDTVEVEDEKNEDEDKDEDEDEDGDSQCSCSSSLQAWYSSQSQSAIIPAPPATSPPPESSSSSSNVSSSNSLHIHHFYLLDPVTFVQQQDAVYNDPKCPIVQPIPVWPPPELVEWRKGRKWASDNVVANNAGKKRKVSEDSDEDGNYVPNSSSAANRSRSSKRVRWKSVDDIAPAPVMQDMTPISIIPRNRAFVLIPSNESFDKSSYRPISIPRLSPVASDDDDEQLGRGLRRRAPKRVFTPELAKPRVRVSSKDDYKPVKVKTRAPRSTAFPGERTCHQCRRSHTDPPAPKMKCSVIKPNGSPCAFVYCISCILIRYDETFIASATTWTCPFCRGICNCSLCIRNAGFGYIWDGPLAADKGVLRRGSVVDGKLKNNAKRQQSMRTWLAKRGVITGSETWMSRRREEGDRFIVGRSPSPGAEAYIPAGDCAFIQEFEKSVENEDEDQDVTVQMEALNGVSSAEQTTLNNSAGSSLSPRPAESNPDNVFALRNYEKGKRFYVGRALGPEGAKRRKASSLQNNTPAAKESSIQKENVDDKPLAMMVLRPPVKRPGYYLELEGIVDDEEMEEEVESSTGVRTRTKTRRKSKHQMEHELSEPTFSFPDSASDPTSNSNTTPDDNASYEVQVPLDLCELEALHTSVPPEEWSSFDYDAQDLMLQKDLTVEMTDWSAVTESSLMVSESDRLPSSSGLHFDVSSPSQAPPNPSLEDDFTMPLPDIYILPTASHPASGGHPWGDVDAVGETDTEHSYSLSVDVDE